MPNNKISTEVKLDGREELRLELEVDQSHCIVSSSLKAIGGMNLLLMVSDWRPKLTGDLLQIEIPEGQDTAHLLLSELILKAQGQWDFPFKQEELCHCRGISLKNVDMAIVTGAHTSEDVCRQTSASTACGTCRPDVDSIIAYRLGKSCPGSVS